MRSILHQIGELCHFSSRRRIFLPLSCTRRSRKCRAGFEGREVAAAVSSFTRRRAVVRPLVEIANHGLWRYSLLCGHFFGVSSWPQPVALGAVEE